MKTKRIPIGALMRNFVTSGMEEYHDVEVMRKVVMFNAVSAIGIANLIPFGILSFVQENPTLAFFDLATAAALIINLVYLRKSGRYDFAGYFGVYCAGALFVYLFATGGQRHTGHLWYYTFPLFASFLLGSKRGALASLVLLFAPVLLFAMPGFSSAFATYTTDFQIRFIPSFLVVLGYSYLFESIREKTQQKLALKNVELEQSIVQLENTGAELQKTRLGLEQRVIERTGKLTEANEQLKQEIEERIRAEERLERINRSFLEFGPNPTENINRLTRLSGELLGATWAVYNRLEGGLLCSLGQWNTPPDYEPEDKPEGHMCFDVIRTAGDDMLIVPDLQNTPYAEADPNVRAYNLQTFMGRAVKCGGEAVGSHCVVFQSDFVPSGQDRKVLEIAASAIGVEEERLRAERALRDSEERYRTVVENIDLGVSLIDSDHNIVHMNTAHGKMYDKPESAFLGKKCFRVFRKEESVCSDCPGVRAMNTGQAARVEAEGVRDDGATFTTIVRAFPAFGPDKEVSGFIEVVEDITEQKHLEARLQQIQKMKSIGTLAGGIAHDFNNLLMAIQGNVSLMLMHLDSAHPHYDRLKRIDSQVESGARLTAHLLGYARKGRYEIRPVDLGQLVEETAETFGRTRKDISIYRELARDLHAIDADRAQIEQVLLNVFINAGDAMPDGGKLTIRAVNRSHLDMRDRLYEPTPGQYVLLTVTDTGIGMDQQTQTRIFDPFFTTKEMGRGTGLGMASAYGIVKGHGGYIDVHSRLGEGATFSIYLPASAKSVGQVPEHTKLPPKGNERVLLVDDEKEIRQVGKELLEAMGYSVLLARDGREAIELYTKKHGDIDIVLLDIVMPNMGGSKTYDKLKEVNPEVKVLIFSGYSIDVKAAEILDRGCNGFIQKPFRAEELSAKLREILDT